MTHRYRSQLSWRGTTGVGYDAYERTHRVAVPPAAESLTVSADPTFRGNPQLANPEQLLLAAVSSCQLLSFLSIAARARIDVVAYDDDAEALMPANAKPMRVTLITLRPQIVLAAAADPGRIRRLVELAHQECFIANSLTAEIIVIPSIETA